jgi:hypothetical protein
MREKRGKIMTKKPSETKNASKKPLTASYSVADDVAGEFENRAEKVPLRPAPPFAQNGRMKKYDKEMLASVKTRYVNGIPRKLAKGSVLVHNHVIPQSLLGLNGFRAWTQTLTDDLEVCSCDWAGVDLRGLVHYRVAGC